MYVPVSRPLGAAIPYVSAVAMITLKTTEIVVKVVSIIIAFTRLTGYSTPDNDFVCRHNTNLAAISSRE